METTKIADLARERGLPYPTIIKRINRGHSVEDALDIPVRNRNDAKETYRVEDRLEEFKKLFVDFTREHRGLSPNLKDIQARLGAGSPTPGRTLCYSLVAKGWLKTVGLGKYIIYGSRWLDPRQALALDKLMVRSVELELQMREILNLEVADPEILDLVSILSEDNENEKLADD